MVAFALVLGVHLTAQFVDLPTLARWTQWLLMPLLATTLWLAAGPHTRLVRLVLVGLVFSWLGDTLPHFFGDGGFLVMVGMFALAQIGYAVAFWPWRSVSLLRSPWALCYLATAVLLVAVCLPEAGALGVPVILYAALITVMALLATGVNLLTGLGAALFILSDSLIALATFVSGWELPGQGFWVMSTYGLAQLLIVLGVLRRVGKEVA